MIVNRLRFFARRQRAFTLLELLVVLIVLALIAGASIAAGLFDSGERDFARSQMLFAQQLYQARLHAMRTGQNVYLRLGEAAELRLPADAALRIDGRTPAPHTIVLYPDGSVTPAKVYLELKGRRAGFAIDGWTGRVIPLEHRAF